MAYIYKITNTLNGKVYIGKTERTVEERFKEHCRDYLRVDISNRPLYRAFSKYGIENFQVETLEETEIPEERERFWIEYYQSFKNGYNATIGGDVRKYLDYEVIYSVYAELKSAPKTAEKLGISVDSVYTAVSQKGKLLTSKESNQLLYGKVVKMFLKNGEYQQSFASLKEAARYLIDNNLTKDGAANGVSSHIRECANGKRKTAYGFIWSW